MAVLPFYPESIVRYPFRFVAPCGNWWKADEVMGYAELAGLEHGQTYTIQQLGLQGRLQPRRGFPPPRSVVYLQCKRMTA